MFTILTIFLVVLCLKLIGFTLKICGKILGGILGMAGFLIVGILAVTAFGLAFAFLPAIIVIGIVALIGGASKVV